MDEHLYECVKKLEASCKYYREMLYKERDKRWAYETIVHAQAQIPRYKRVERANRRTPGHHQCQLAKLHGKRVGELYKALDQVGLLLE